MSAFALSIAGSSLLGACGETIDATGVVVRKLEVARERLGPAPADISGRQFVNGSADGSLLRFKRADVVGDEAEETVVELPRGRGVAIRGSDGVLGEIRTDEYLTDFDAIAIAERPKRQLVLYTYPNSARGGTFRIVTPDGRELARWTESPPPGRLAVAAWNGVETIFYIQNDELVRRSAAGAELSRMSLPEGHKFSRLHIAPSADGRLIALASGDGYTPYHTVCLYDRGGELVFQEIASEHAFELEAVKEQSDFVVVTRSARWRFVPRPG